MKQRSKILTALFSQCITGSYSGSFSLSSCGGSGFAAVEEIDVVPEEEISDSEEVSTSTEVLFSGRHYDRGF